MPRILSVQPASHTQNPKARGIMSNRANMTCYWPESWRELQTHLLSISYSKIWILWEPRTRKSPNPTLVSWVLGQTLSPGESRADRPMQDSLDTTYLCQRPGAGKKTETKVSVTVRFPLIFSPSLNQFSTYPWPHSLDGSHPGLVDPVATMEPQGSYITEGSCTWLGS